jgi:L-seryl-tRNA(Ser) seleniumtransferase
MSFSGEHVQARLRALPAVDRLAAAVCSEDYGAERAPTQAEAVAAARAVLAERRAELLAGAPEEDVDLLARAQARLAPSMRRVLNGTGVVIHTNLGRAPLPAAAAEAVANEAHGYCNVELDLESGTRGSRHAHVAELLRELTGAEDAIAVNNGAGAALLAIAALAGHGGAVAVSRGQLVEIGGGFRVPDVLAQAGARMIEVGTTNRTRLADYQHALAAPAPPSDATPPDASAAATPAPGPATHVLRVHQSNFRIVGFVEEVSIEALCSLGVPVIDDVGSGALTHEMPAMADEPLVRRSIAAGAAVVCFSGDKLLGGPQAGILAGRAEAIDACRRHPLARALRIGRLPLAALAATLLLYRDPERARREIPVLAMLDVAPDELRARVDWLARAAAAHGGAPTPRIAITEAVARVGGGALPLLRLNGPVVALGTRHEDPEQLARTLRVGDPPLLARIADGRVLVDPRTLAPSEIDEAAAAIARGLAATAGASPRHA